MTEFPTRSDRTYSIGVGEQFEATLEVGKSFDLADESGTAIEALPYLFVALAAGSQAENPLLDGTWCPLDRNPRSGDLGPLDHAGNESGTSPDPAGDLFDGNPFVTHHEDSPLDRPEHFGHILNS